MRVFGLHLIGPCMMSADARVVGAAKAEKCCDLAQIFVLGRAQAAIGQRDVKQSAEKMLQHCPVGGKEAPDLPRVALKPMGAPARQVEDQPDVILLARRNLKDLAKGGNLVAGDGAVGPGHLGAQRDDRDRERDAPVRISLRWLAIAMTVPVRNVARGAFEQRPQRTAEGQLTSARNNAAYKAHPKPSCQSLQPA